MKKIYIKTKTITNALYLYVIYNSLIILLYNLGWSYLLPKLSFKLLFFLFATIIIAWFFGYLLNKSKFLPKYKIINLTHNTDFVFFILILLIIIEMVHNRGVPLLMLLKGMPYNYRDFGIKTLHVFILTFIAFYTIYLFHLFISTKKNKILIEFLILLTYPILIINRGDLMMTLFGILMVFLLSITRVSFKKVVILLIFIIISLFIFGVLGNIRMHKNYTSLFYPTKSFQKSHIPSEFLWPYMYIVSPLGNLEDTTKKDNYIYSLKGFIFASLIPNAISKHFNYKTNKIKKIIFYLVVGTMYSSAYANLGWVGMIFIFFYLIAFIFIYLILLRRNNPYSVTGYAILLTIIVFNAFSNMIVFSGLSFQLVYPLLLGFLHKYKFKLI